MYGTTYAPLAFNVLVAAVFFWFFHKDREKSLHAVRLAFKSFLTLLPLLVVVGVLLIFTQVVFSEEVLIKYPAEFTGALGYVVAALLGAFVHLPFFIVFPIGGQLLEKGVNPGFIAVLITSLVMVHTFSIPVEIKEMGLKFAVVRNLLCFAFALCIGIIIGVIY